MLETAISVLVVLFVLLLFIAAVLIFRATIYGRAPDVVDPVEVPPVEGPVVAEHLSEAIRQQTVSGADPRMAAPEAFEALHTTLERLYPRLHATLRRERVNNSSLLYTWPGRGDEPPVLLCAHLDVVPADPATKDDWTHPPFSGAVADGCVWGRGALDMKSTAIAILEAVEGLIKAGYEPERSVYLALGHDEEIGGWRGAHCIAELLVERGEKLALVLDEGAAVMDGMLPGLGLPVALVGVSEKGHASVELRVEGRSGHSSVPPRHTAIGVLARAITRLEASPMQSRLSMAGLLFNDLGAFLPFGLRLALANMWLFKKSILKRLAASPQTNALVRTTMAATVIQGGVKDNILPAQARAVINCRLLPGDTCQSVLEHIRRTVNDEAVQIHLPEEAAWDAAPISPIDSPEYAGLARTIRQVFPEAVVAPYLVSGATDSRHYVPLTSSIYRFSPFVLNADLLKTIHGIDERIPVEGLARMVQFYQVLLRSWTTSS